MSKNILLLVFSAALITFQPLHAQNDCSARQSVREKGDCFYAALGRAESAMDATYRRSLASYDPSDAHLATMQRLPRSEWESQRRWLKRVRAKLQESQKEFLAYRDGSCSALEMTYQNGSIVSWAIAACKLDLTEQRTKWLDGFPK